MNLCDFQVKCQCHCKRSTDQLYVFGGVCLWMHLPAAYHMLSLGTWRVRMNRSEVNSRRMALWPALLPVTWGWCHCWHPIARSQVQCNYPPLKPYHRRCMHDSYCFLPAIHPTLRTQAHWSKRHSLQISRGWGLPLPQVGVSQACFIQNTKPVT